MARRLLKSFRAWQMGSCRTALRSTTDCSKPVKRYTATQILSCRKAVGEMRWLWTWRMSDQSARGCCHLLAYFHVVSLVACDTPHSQTASCTGMIASAQYDNCQACQRRCSTLTSLTISSLQTGRGSEEPHAQAMEPLQYSAGREVSQLPEQLLAGVLLEVLEFLQVSPLHLWDSLQCLLSCLVKHHH